ncbi:LBP / BPI / CETP family C-terminal domain protein [Brugia pahangi]
MMESVMLIFVLFVGCFGLNVKYLDSDVQLQPLSSTINHFNNTQSRRFDTVNDDNDINSQLFNGIRGLPGLEFQIKPKAFSYANLLAASIIDEEIRRIRILPVKQCFQQFNGCIAISNFIISRYRCPQLVTFHPAPPNRLIFTIRNFDLEIKGDINGEIKVILPIKLNSTVYTRFHQILTTVQLTIHRKLNGSPYVRNIGCYVTAGFSDVFLQNGGILEDIFNSNFRGSTVKQIRKQLPIRVCQMIRNIVKKKINIPLQKASKVIPLSEMIKFAINNIKISNLPKHCYMEMCKKKMQTDKSAFHFSTSKKKLNLSLISVSDTHHITTKNDNTRFTLSPISLTTSHISVREGTNTSTILDPCSDCYANKKSTIFKSLIRSDKCIYKDLPNIVLNLHIIKVLATPDYFQLGLRAVFAPEEEIIQMPFHPFPMHFPQNFNNENENERMLDVLISDYTINSLLYHMHKNDFIMFRVGPETPELSELLKTTCTDEDYDDFGDFDIEDDEELDDENNSTVILAKLRRRQKRSVINSDNDNSDNNQESNDNDGDIFGDLGVCLGDIMPAIREKYPRKLIHVKIYSKRAPFVILLAKDNGTARVNLELEAALHINDSGEKVGTMLISSVIDGNIQLSANRVNVLIKIQSLKLIDKEETLGLPPDALDNLANLSKDIIAQTVSNELSNGLTIELATEKLPYNLVKPKFSIIDHAIHLSTDINILSNIIGTNKLSTNCRRF